MTSLVATSAARRRKDRVARAMLALGTGIALVPLGLILYYLLRKGLGAWSWHFFTTDPTGSFLGDPGGIRSAIVGTVVIVALAALMAVPLGVGVALYLTEFGRDGRLARGVRFLIDVMTGVPSIVFGLFIYISLVVTPFFLLNNIGRYGVCLFMPGVPSGAVSRPRASTGRRTT